MAIQFTKNGQGLLIERQFASAEQSDLASCYAIPKRQGNNSEIYEFDFNRVTKKALSYSLKSFIPNIKSLPNQEKFFERIKNAYDTAQSDFDTLVKERVWYYDKLYQHQKDGAFFSCYRKYTLLAFEQGLGKSITSLTKSVINDFQLTIIVTKAGLKRNWLEEMCYTKNPTDDSELMWGFDPDEVTVIDGVRPKTAVKEKYVIINYEVVGKYMDALVAKNPQHIIFDECQNIKNKDSQRTKSCTSLVNRTGAHVSLLSGTPSPNKTIDMFAYLHMVNHPYGRKYASFLKRFTYFTTGKWGVQIKGGKNIEELHISMLNFMLRKTKKECLDLPDKNYIKINFELNEYEEEYNLAFEEYLETLRKKNKEEDTTALSRLNIITSKCKIKDVLDLAESINEQEVETASGSTRKKKVIIFTSYTEPIDMLAKHFGDRCVVIDGRVPSHKRQELVNEFKNSDKVDFFLGNITAAGTGLNLTCSSDVILLNFPYTQAEIDQATDRAHRIGQLSQVNVYYTVCKNSIDEQLYNLVAHKYKQTSLLVDGAEDIITPENVGKLFIEQFRTAI